MTSRRQCGRDKREYPERPIVGVGGVVIENGRALLIRRAHPPLAGEWSIPGGSLRVGETILEAVRRELREETSLRVRVLELLEVFDRIYPDAQGRPQYHFVILDYWCQRLAGAAKAGSDVTAVAWARERELPAYNLSETATRIIRKAFALSGCSDPSRLASGKVGGISQNHGESAGADCDIEVSLRSSKRPRRRQL